MQKTIVAAAVGALLLGTSPAAGAQDIEDFVAFAGLTRTPVGAFAPLSPRSEGRPTFDLRYGRMKFDGDDDAVNNFGIGGSFAAGPTTLHLSGGVLTCNGCRSLVMLGADLTAALATRPLGTNGNADFSVALQPSIGYGKGTGDDGVTALSVGLGLPLSISIGRGDGARVVPFLTPGYGYGRLSGSGDEDSGTRTMLGGGLAFTNLGGSMGIHLGFQKVFLEDAPTTFGLGFSLAPRRASAAR